MYHLDNNKEEKEGKEGGKAKREERTERGGEKGAKKKFKDTIQIKMNESLTDQMWFSFSMKTKVQIFLEKDKLSVSTD